MAIWGYSELDSLLVKNHMAHNGFLVDTNILVSATYDSDKFHTILLILSKKLLIKIFHFTAMLIFALSF